ncbi:MAG: UbiD family decarboxylase [Desulfuromonadales bacterium]|nr:UbiD family decarboxylase [Desulfuromonadales bacterium]
MLPYAFDLRKFIEQLIRNGELHTIAVPVALTLEIARITDRVSKAHGPALCFSAPQPTALPILTNLFGSPRRAAWALGAEEEDLSLLIERLTSLLQGESGGAAQRLASLCRGIKSTLVPPCWQEVAGELAELPFLQSWPEDGGSYLTLPLVVTRHPESGALNWGIYRVQRSLDDSLLIHWKEGSGAGAHARAWQERGEPMPVAIVLGAPPALLWAAAAPLPAGIDEAAFVGLLAGEALPLSCCTSIDLLVPAVAEAVLEGYVSPDDVGLEGPFGNHSGSYAPATLVPRLRLSALHRRRDGCFPATVVGPPPMEDCYLAALTPQIFLPLLRIDYPEVVALAMPLEGIFHGCALVAADPGGDGAALLARLRATDLLRRSRLLILFGPEVDVHDYAAAFWRALNAVDPQRDLTILSGIGLNIDASRPLSQPLSPDPQIVTQVAARAGEYGLPAAWFIE